MGKGLDYGDRPSKNVTRRILVEILRRAQFIDRLSNYTYVGFGAHQFLDFDLVHRQLGINRMISIESDEKLISRCHFNAPYKGIEILEGTATTVLPTIDWKRKSIVWLDYTQRLRASELADCENVALRLQPGSFFAITLNCHSGKDGERREALQRALGSELVPIGITEAKLGEWGLAKTQREVVTSTLHRALASRADGATWQQLLNIHYRDEARMQLLVGVIDHPSLHDEIQSCHFEDLQEVSTDADALVVEIPQLTVRERHVLDKKLPARSLKEFVGIPERELSSYARLYRWLDPAG